MSEVIGERGYIMKTGKHRTCLKNRVGWEHISCMRERQER